MTPAELCRQNHAGPAEINSIVIIANPFNGETAYTIESIRDDGTVEINDGSDSTLWKQLVDGLNYEFRRMELPRQASAVAEEQVAVIVNSSFWKVRQQRKAVPAPG